MMTSIGRNDPCPCGSGKKYKACHGAGDALSDVQALFYQRLRELDGEAEKKLLRFVDQNYDQETVEEAWRDFLFSDDLPEDPDPVDLDFFRRWLLYSWCPEDEDPLALLYVSEKGERIDPDLRRFIEATANAPYSFLQVSRVEAGRGLTARDLLRKRELRIVEHTASLAASPGSILFARAVELNGIVFLMGSGPDLLPAAAYERILRLREDLVRETPPGDRGILTDGFLLAYEEELRDVYYEIADQLYDDRPPELRNTDGDPVELQTLTYRITSFGQAFLALKDLEQRGERDEEILARAECDEAGNPVRLVLHWFGSRPPEGSPDAATILAALEIRDTELVVEVNSAERGRRVREEISRRLGASAVLLRTESTPQERIWESPGAADAATGSDAPPADGLMNDPAVRAAAAEMSQRHWAAWLDMKIPALRNMTPREAARDPVGRELLESLLLDFESRNLGNPDTATRPDVERLRRELGMEKS